MAISAYAAKTRKRREKNKRDKTVTIGSEREDNEPPQNKDNQGFEEEEQEPLGQEKPVRKSLNQLYSNKILVPSDQQLRHVTEPSLSYAAIGLDYRGISHDALSSSFLYLAALIHACY